MTGIMMTVCVAIKVHDCIVFAADSAISTVVSTPDGAPNVSNVWQHGLKVFNLHRELPIMAMTAGLGNFGSVSVSNLAKDLRLHLTRTLPAGTTQYTIQDVANIASQHFQTEYAKINPPPLNPPKFEFWIGGYSSNAMHGEIWKVEIVNGQPVLPYKCHDPNFGEHIILWGGQIQAISRLVLGCDPQLSQFIPMQDRLNAETPLVNPFMPVQDAINLADFLVDMTKRYVAFMPGADTVGGDTDIATVTRHEGFKWVCRKHYYSQHLNRGATDHAT